MKKSTSIFSIFYLLALFLYPLAAAAQSTSPSSPLTLEPPDTDLSIEYLRDIFGTVDGVFSGNNNLLGIMFGIFNGAVLTLGGIVILYTLFVSTLNTAHEGEMLGKRWSSIWIPLRSVIGIALLVPKATGYSFIQIFMMWVAVMGVGAADSIWNSALDFFGRGGALIQQNIMPGNNKFIGASNVTKDAQTLLQSLTCMEMLQSQLEKYRNVQIQTQNPIINAPVPNFYQRLMSSLNTQLSNGAGILNFPTLDLTFYNDTYYRNLSGECGSISWTNPADNLNNPLNSLDPNNISYANQAAAVTQSRGLAVSSMIQQLDSAAKTIVSNYQNSNIGEGQLAGNAAPKPLGHIVFPSTGSAGNAPYLWGGGSLQTPIAPLFSSGSLFSDAVNVYFSIMSPTLNLIDNGSKLASSLQWINTAKKAGWIMAGRFYFDIIALNNAQTITEAAGARTLHSPKINFTNESPAVVSAFFPANSDYLAKLDDLINNNGTYGVSATGTAGQGFFMFDALTYGNSLTYGNISSIGSATGTAESSGYGRIDSVLEPVIGIGGYIRQALQDLATSQSQNFNPIVALAQMGNGLVGTVFTTFITVGVIVMAMNLTLAFVPFIGGAIVSAIMSVVMVLMSLITPILVPLFIAGLIMTFYLPVISFIIFLFGAIGWLISVIEAIIAAPLVALGIAHPEGQEILGKAEPAVLLLVNVFLRPTLMIFGLLTGMMLSYVGIWLLNEGFALTFANASHYATMVVNDLFAPYAYLVIYVAIVTQVVHRSFALIHIIPDEVLKWIGGNVKGMGGEAEAEGKIAGAAQSAADAASKPVSSAPKAGKDMGKAIGGIAKAVKEGKDEGSESSDASLEEGESSDSSAAQSGGGAEGGGAAVKGMGSGIPPVV